MCKMLNLTLALVCNSRLVTKWALFFNGLCTGETWVKCLKFLSLQNVSHLRQCVIKLEVELAMRTTTFQKLAKVQQGEKGFRHHYSRVSFMSSIVLLLFKLRLRPSEMRLPSSSNSSLALHTENAALLRIPLVGRTGFVGKILTMQFLF